MFRNNTTNRTGHTNVCTRMDTLFLFSYRDGGRFFFNTDTHPSGCRIFRIERRPYYAGAGRPYINRAYNRAYSGGLRLFQKISGTRGTSLISDVIV